MPDLFDVQVPALGESVSEATIAKWLKADGDFVASDDIIAELETDKASVEMVPGKPGTLRIVAAKGDTVPVGAVIAKIDLEGKPPASATTPAPSASAPAKDPSAAPNSVDLKA